VVPSPWEEKKPCNKGGGAGRRGKEKKKTHSIGSLKKVGQKHQRPIKEKKRKTRENTTKRQLSRIIKKKKKPPFNCGKTSIETQSCKKPLEFFFSKVKPKRKTVKRGPTQGQKEKQWGPVSIYLALPRIMRGFFLVL